MPRDDELPDVLKRLTRRHAVRLTHERLQSDTKSLIKQLKRGLKNTEKARTVQQQAALRAQIEEARLKKGREIEEQRRAKESERKPEPVSAKPIATVRSPWLGSQRAALIFLAIVGALWVIFLFLDELRASAAGGCGHGYDPPCHLNDIEFLSHVSDVTGLVLLAITLIAVLYCVPVVRKLLLSVLHGDRSS